MTVSLGTRVSGWLVAGAVAIVAVAFTGGGRDALGPPDQPGRPMIAGPSSGAVGGTVTPAPTPEHPPLRSSPAGGVGGTATATPPTASRPPGTSPGPVRPSPTDRPGTVRLRWLPPGPDSPDADRTADPARVYDILRDPGRCGEALAAVPAATDDPEWLVLRGLASACLAVQGRDGHWEAARRARDAVAEDAVGCKGVAALAVLDGLLDFARRHPGQSAVLGSAAAEAPPACAFGITGVDTGTPAATVRPGERVRIGLRGVFFDVAELAVGGEVVVDGRTVPVTPEHRPGAAPGVSVTVPPDLAGLPRTVSVTVRYGGEEAVLEDAFGVVAGPGPGSTPGAQEPGGVPGGVPGGSPGGVPGGVPGGSPGGVPGGSAGEVPEGVSGPVPVPVPGGEPPMGSAPGVPEVAGPGVAGVAGPVLPEAGVPEVTGPGVPEVSGGPRPVSPEAGVPEGWGVEGAGIPGVPGMPGAVGAPSGVPRR